MKKPIEISIGGIVEIPVPANPASTGFLCTLDKMPACLNLVSMDFVAGTPIIPGMPGKEIFKFVGIAEGSGTIEFNHIRFSHPIEIASRDPPILHQDEFWPVIVKKQ
jgi:hypothetical protein